MNENIVKCIYILRNVSSSTRRMSVSFTIKENK